MCSGTTIEHPYFKQITAKGAAESDIFYPYGQFIAEGKKYFQGLYLKLVRSRNAKIKRFSTLPTRTASDEIYETYVDSNNDLERDTDIYKMLIRKASC